VKKDTKKELVNSKPVQKTLQAVKPTVTSSKPLNSAKTDGKLEVKNKTKNDTKNESKNEVQKPSIVNLNVQKGDLKVKDKKPVQNNTPQNGSSKTSEGKEAQKSVKAAINSVKVASAKEKEQVKTSLSSSEQVKKNWRLEALNTDIVNVVEMKQRS
jgi:hypothetical protein